MKNIRVRAHRRRTRSGTTDVVRHKRSIEGKIKLPKNINGWKLKQTYVKGFGYPQDKTIYFEPMWIKGKQGVTILERKDRWWNVKKLFYDEDSQKFKFGDKLNGDFPSARSAVTYTVLWMKNDGIQPRGVSSSHPLYYA